MSLDEKIRELDEHIAGRVRQWLREQHEVLGRKLGEEITRQLDGTTDSLPSNLISAEETAELEASLAPAERPEKAPSGAPASALLEAVAAVDQARSQASALGSLLSEGNRFASRLAVFLIRTGKAAGWRCQGFGEAAEALQSLSLPFEDEGPWDRLARGRACVPMSAADCARLCSRIEAPLPKRGLLIPLVLRDQVAAAVYADQVGDDGVLEPAALQLLTHTTALAIETMPFRERQVTTPTLVLDEADFVGEDDRGLGLWGASAAEPAAPEPIPEEAPGEAAGSPPPEAAAEAGPAGAEVGEVTVEDWVSDRETEEESAPPVVLEAAEEEDEEDDVYPVLRQEIPGAEARAGGTQTPEPSAAEATLPDTPELEASVTETHVSETQDVGPILVDVEDEEGDAASAQEPSPAGAEAAEPPLAEPYDDYEFELQETAPAPPVAQPEALPWQDDEDVVEGTELVEAEPEEEVEVWEAEPETEQALEPETLETTEPGSESLRTLHYPLPSTAEEPAPPSLPGAGDGGYADPDDTVLLGRTSAEAPPAEPSKQDSSFDGDETHPGGYAAAPQAGIETADEGTPPPSGRPSEVAPPSDVEGPGWAFGDRSQPSSDDEEMHEKAKRLARLLVSEIKLYNEEQVEEGQRNKDIYERLKEDIDRSRQMYEDRVDDRVSSTNDYFYQELVRTLAGGDPQALGI